MTTTPISSLRKLIHALRTPLTTLELSLDRAYLMSLSIENCAQLQKTIDTAKIQCQRIEKCLEESNMLESIGTSTSFMQPHNTIVPLCYFPTTTILIDDDMQFLTEMRSALLERKLLLTCYQSPMEAFIELKQQPRISDLRSIWLRPLITDELDTQTPQIQLDFSSIFHVIEEPTRSSRVSVIVIDYHMEEQNGLDFCQSLAGQPFKKILMTGDDDYPRAVAAFNAGLIDRFILKGQAQFADKLAQMIRELEYASFMAISLSAYEWLPTVRPIVWTDPVYHEFIQNWITEQNLQEYYWLDSRGSLLGLTAQGHPIACIVKTEEELAEFELIAHEQQGSPELVTILKQREQIIILLTPEEHHLPVHEWLTRLHPVCCIEGREQYYYAILQHEALQPLLTKTKNSI